LNLSSKIKQLFAKLYFKIWPFTEQIPSGKPLNLVGGKIVLFFNYPTEDVEILLVNQIPNLKKQLEKNSRITICNMSDDSVPTESDNAVFFSMNDYNLFGKSKPRLKEWLSNNEFDILISFANNENIFCNSQICNIKADFKAGLYNPDNVKLFDLTIKQKSDDISLQLESFIHYLNKLNINR